MNKISFYSGLNLMLAFSLLLAGFSCSTKRHKWANRAYHSTTAKYNGYFNGVETLKEAVNQLQTGAVDNYYKILPVYPLGTLEDSKGIFTLADKAIKKAAIVIKKHSLLIKGKEYNKYIDDCYMLYGQALFYKRDYYAALEMFAYVARDPIKNTKKDPINHLVNIWLSRGYAELGMFGDAQSALDRSINDKALPNRIKGDLYTAQADFYLKQNNYVKALESVKEAVKFTKKKKVRTRLIFIQAQLHQKIGELKEASLLYSKVLKMNPSYEMAFYARINIARTYSAENNNSKDIRLLLARMLKDPKNIDFNDQIYYVLGEIEEKEEQTDRAIEQYKKSVKATTTNTSQKGISYLAIAEIYLDGRDYKPAAAYYDSAYTSLSKDYPEYKQVENIRNSLAELIKKYQLITLYDSLLQLASLSKEELNKKVEQMIRNEERDRKLKLEKEAKEAALQAAKDAINASSSGGSVAGGNGLWYFYNPSTKSFGFSEFKKTWGGRKLEDNWRRSNKQAVFQQNQPSQNDQMNADSTAIPGGKILSHSDSVELARKRLTENIPKTDEQKKACADTVREAYYDLGMIYKERLGDYRMAAETFEDFNRNYPGNSSEAAVYYQLFRIYLKIPDAAKAELNKNLILKKFPDSEYASIIKDPNFFANANLSKKETDVFYEESYRLYQAKQYMEVLNRCRMAETKYAGNQLMGKFALLKALAIGQLKDVSAFRSALESVVKTYPTEGVKTKAQELITGLDKAQGILPRDSASVKKSIYTYKADTTHFMLILVEDRGVDLNLLKTALSNFNETLFSLKSLKINSRLLGTNYQLVTVESFENKKAGSDYLLTLDDDDTVFEGMDMNLIDVLIISEGNYQALMRDEGVTDYLEFYKQVYQ